jgi:hypothetical protein
MVEHDPPILQRPTPGEAAMLFTHLNTTLSDIVLLFPLNIARSR